MQFRTITLIEKIDLLTSHGFTIGVRNPLINTDFKGQFMCVENMDELELPTKDASNGPFAIVGDDLEELVNEAYMYHFVYKA